MSDHLPRYVEYGANPRYQPPFTIRGCQMYNFILEADYGCQQAILDRCLNIPSGGAVDFRVVGLPGLSYMMLSFVNLQHQSSREADLGWVGEKEATLWVFAWDARNHRFSWFIPYIFVNGDAVLITGREDYGFPKRLGWLTFPNLDQPDAFSVDTTVIPTYEPTTQAVRGPLIEIHRSSTQKSDETPTSAYSTLSHLCRDVADRVFDGHVLSVGQERSAHGSPATGLVSGTGNLIRREVSSLEHKMTRVGEALEQGLFDIGEALGLGNIPLVFLKQFRDATDTDRACYQGIIGSLFHVTNFSTGYFLGDYDITLFDYPSTPIRQDFGLAAGTLKPKLSFFAEYDSVVEPGTELWKAT